MHGSGKLQFTTQLVRFIIAAKLSVLLILVWVATTDAQAPPLGYNAPTDRVNHTEPALTGALDLTVAGHKQNYVFTDPTFGSTVTRITDETTNPDTGYVGRSYTTASSAETNEWNADSTMFYVGGPGGERIFFAWDGTTHQATRIGSPTATSGGVWTVGLLDGSPCWSFKNPKILYGVYGYTLRSLDFTTVNGSSTTIPATNLVDLATLYHTVTGGTLTGYVGEVGIAGASVSDNIITIPMNGSGQDTWTWVLWYDLTTGTYKILDTTGTAGHVRTYNSATSIWTTGSFVGGWNIHNARSALDGRYVSVTAGNVHIPGFGVMAQWDTQTGAVSAASAATSDGHRVAGFNYWINSNGSGGDVEQWLIRPFSDVSTTTNVLTCLLSDPCSSPQYPVEWQNEDHLSWNNARSATLYPFIASIIREGLEDGSNPWRPWDGEIVAVAADGSGTVWRLGHHHSRNRPGGPRSPGFDDQVFANVSPDGKYILFGSNWGMTLLNNGQYRIDAFVLTPPALTTPTAENVVWTNAVGVTVSGNNLTKTAAGGWGNAGAFSTRGLASGDGYAEFTTTENNKSRMFGLSLTDGNQSYEGIRYAVHPDTDGNAAVYESGNYRTNVAYAAGDHFRIAVESGVVKYYKNGTLFYTSAVTPTYPLYVDTALNTGSSTITNAIISGTLTGPTAENVVWTNAVGVTVSGNNLTKTAAGGWGNAGAFSTRGLASGDGYAEFTTTENNKSRVFGLSLTDGNQSYEGIRYAVHPDTDGNAAVYESGNYRTNVAYAAGDHFRIAVESGVVKYYKNGTLFYTSAVTPTYPLYVDTALNTGSSTITNAIISGTLTGPTAENVVWTNAVGVTVSGNNLTKTAAGGWGNAGAFSTRGLASGDGYAEFTTTENNKSRMFGLSLTDGNQSYEGIRYAVHPDTDGNAAVYESGNYRTNVAYAAGDHFRIAVESGVVKYYKNGTLFYTSAVTPTYPLYVDTALNTGSSTITNAIISGTLTGP